MFSKKALTYALICLLLSLGGILGGFYTTKKVLAVTESRFEQLELFNKVLYLIETQYYRKVDTKKLIEGAIHGMVKTLDPHSSYLPQKLFEKIQNETSGEFGGLGIEVTEKDGVLYIISTLEGSPARKKGIAPGDKVVEIDYEPVLGLGLEKTVEKLRGKPGKKIILGLIKKGNKQIQRLTLTREKIQSKPVKSELIQEHYAFLKLTSFQKRSTKLIVRALKKLSKQAKKPGGIKGIILDLRWNPGGLLEEAVSLSSVFLKEGTVVSIEGRDPKNKDIHYVLKSGYKDLKTPMIVLVNGASASASEIVAGALQDYSRAIIMGSDSFGKGLVQTVAKIDSQENGLKLTIAEYKRPKGGVVNNKGVQVDIKTSGHGNQEDTLEPYFIRQRDLRSDRTSVIESDDEKQERLNRERESRLKRRKELEKREKSSQKKDEYLYRDYTPAEDEEVKQAINYLKGASIIGKRKV